MWYPMIVGSDERRYAWMDEGFNTFINTFRKRAIGSGMIRRSGNGSGSWSSA